MIEIRCRPIDQWHGPRTQDWERRRGQYSAGRTRTLNELERELDAIDAIDVTLGLDLKASDIRLDGWPRASANPPPPVSITFGSKYGPKRFECDQFADWRQNVRAIGLTLQRLRLVDEGGCTQRGEQYVGFGALPPGQPTPLAAAMTIDEAVQLLAEHGDGLPVPNRVVSSATDRADLDAAWRAAAKRLHPDAGGDAAAFRRLREARDLLAGAAP